MNVSTRIRRTNSNASHAVNIRHQRRRVTNRQNLRNSLNDFPIAGLASRRRIQILARGHPRPPNGNRFRLEVSQYLASPQRIMLGKIFRHRGITHLIIRTKGDNMRTNNLT